MAKPYHICFTFHGDITYDSRLLKCVRSLASKGYRVSAVIAGKKSGSFPLSDVSLFRVPVPERRRGAIQFAAYYLRGLRPAIRTRAHCYFASDLYSLPLAFTAARIRRAKLVYDSRELYSAVAALRYRVLVQRFWSFIERRMIRRANAVFTVNDSLAELISTRYSVPTPIVLLNCPRRQEVQKTQRLRELLSIPSEKKIILYQGGLQKGRGIFLSLQVIRKIPNAVLVFMGSGQLAMGIRRIIERRELQHKVFVVDTVPVQELLSYTASADVGLCLIENLGMSYYHSLPNKLFEYAVAGVPVIASDFPEIRRFVESDKVGLVVNPENEEEVTGTLARLCDEEELHKSLVENCKVTARKYFWENEEEKLVTTIEKLEVS